VAVRSGHEAAARTFTRQGAHLIRPLPLAAMDTKGEEAEPEPEKRPRQEKLSTDDAGSRETKPAAEESAAAGPQWQHEELNAEDVGNAVITNATKGETIPAVEPRSPVSQGTTPSPCPTLSNSEVATTTHESTVEATATSIESPVEVKDTAGSTETARVDTAPAVAATVEDAQIPPAPPIPPATEESPSPVLSGVMARKRNRSLRESAKSVLAAMPQIPIHVTQIKRLIQKDKAKDDEATVDCDRLLSVLTNGATGRNPTFFKVSGHCDVFGLRADMPKGTRTEEVVETVPDEDGCGPAGDGNVLYAKLPDGHPILTEASSEGEDSAGADEEDEEEANQHEDEDLVNDLELELAAAAVEEEVAELPNNLGGDQEKSAFSPDDESSMDSLSDVANVEQLDRDCKDEEAMITAEMEENAASEQPENSHGNKVNPGRVDDEGTSTSTTDDKAPLDVPDGEVEVAAEMEEEEMADEMSAEVAKESAEEGPEASITLPMEGSSAVSLSLEEAIEQAEVVFDDAFDFGDEDSKEGDCANESSSTATVEEANGTANGKPTRSGEELCKPIEVDVSDHVDGAAGSINAKESSALSSPTFVKRTSPRISPQMQSRQAAAAAAAAAAAVTASSQGSTVPKRRSASTKADGPRARVSAKPSTPSPVPPPSAAPLESTQSTSGHNLRPKRTLRHVNALKQQAKRRKRNTSVATAASPGTQATVHRALSQRRSSIASNGDIEIHYKLTARDIQLGQSSGSPDSSASPSPSSSLLQTCSSWSSSPTMKDILASIPGFPSLSRLRPPNLTASSKKSGTKKLSAAAALQQVREGVVDMESPDSILTQVSLRSLLNKSTFMRLPPAYQFKLMQLLPEVDNVSDPKGKSIR
jgi:hypothetical protein